MSQAGNIGQLLKPQLSPPLTPEICSREADATNTVFYSFGKWSQDWVPQRTNMSSSSSFFCKIPEGRYKIQVQNGNQIPTSFLFQLLPREKGTSKWHWQLLFLVATVAGSPHFTWPTMPSPGHHLLRSTLTKYSITQKKLIRMAELFGN